jgi:hypothetical protein
MLGAVSRGGAFPAGGRVFVAGQQAVQEDVDDVRAGFGIAALVAVALQSMPIMICAVLAGSTARISPRPMPSSIARAR